MRERLMLIVLSLSLTASTAAQTAHPRKLAPPEVAALRRVIDAAQNHQLEGDRSIGWDAHFMKGPNGLTYVPFTVFIRAPHDAVAVYMRVVQRSPIDDNTSRALLGSLSSRGAVGLDSMRESRRMAFARPVFEEAVGLPATGGADDGRSFRAALMVPPGRHDMYIAIRGPSDRGQAPMLLQRTIEVPKFPEAGLCLSSVVRVDRVEPIGASFSEKDRIVHPYVIGRSELIPRTSADFRRGDTLNLAFLVYNASMDGQGRPDIEISYQLFEERFFERRGIGETPPQRLDATTLPSNFDLRAGHQLAAMQSLPLEPYAVGEYTVNIVVTDRRNGARVAHQMLFRIWP